MLAEKMKVHGATAWLVNTGWTAGPYGVGCADVAISFCEDFSLSSQGSER